VNERNNEHNRGDDNWSNFNCGVLHFFPQYSVKTEWDRVLLVERVRDTLNTIDRLDKIYEFAVDTTSFEDFIGIIFPPEIVDVSMVWWKEVNDLPEGESSSIPYFTEGHKESMVDVVNDIFFDNFNDGENHGWSVISGTWSFEDGMYKESVFFGNAVSLVDNQTSDNMIIKVKFNSQGIEFLENAYIIFDYKNPNDFKFAGAHVGNDYWTIGNFSGTWDNYATSSEAIDTSTWYNMKVIIKDNTATLYVGNEKKVEYTFISIDSGKIGLGGRTNNVHFDDFFVDTGVGYKVYSFALGLGYPY